VAPKFDPFRPSVLNGKNPKDHTLFFSRMLFKILLMFKISDTTRAEHHFGVPKFPFQLSDLNSAGSQDHAIFF
jgi:hypothetical protein